MANVKIPLISQLNFRTNDTSKDSKMQNCYQESSGGRKYLVKRPAKSTFTVTPTLPAVGQGLWTYNNDLYAAANGGIYKITGGTRTSIGTVSSTTNNISWVNTGSITSPYMVLHDKANGYVLSSTGTFTNIGQMVGGVVLTSGGTGATTGTWGTSGGGGTGAAGTFTVSAGSIVSVTITNHGSGYTSTPTIVATTGSLGTGVITAWLNAFPANPVPGLVYLDGYVFAMDQSAQVWQSNQEDPTTWNPLNYITAKGEPDKGVAIAKHFNYLVAFKQWTTEFLYDNANPTGSVLAINTPARIELGCATGDSVVTFEQTVVWMATTKEGGRTIALLEGLRPKVISTTAVEKFLNASNLSGVYAWAYKIANHTFYGLVLTDQNVTLVYDLEEKEWHLWTTSKQFIGGGEGYFECTFVQQYPINGGTYYVLDAVTGNTYIISPNTYVDPFGPVMVRVVTPRMDFNTSAKKSCGELVIFGDNINDTISVRHTDDDYTTWSSYRTVNLNLQKPVLYNNGSFRRRAYELYYTGTNPLRLEFMDLDLRGKHGDDER